MLMQDNINQQPTAPQIEPPQTTAPFAPGQPQKKRKIWQVLLIGIAVLVAIPLGIMLVGAIQKTLNSGAENLFYEALGKASQEQKLRIEHAHYRFASEQDKAANTLNSSLNSMTEFDNATGNYSTVYLKYLAGTYSLGRCVNGKEYDHKKMFLKTLEDAEAELASPATALAKNHAIRSACNYKDVFRSGYLSDGIIPAALTTQQGQTWINALKASQILEIKDEGQGEYAGKKGRKISFVQKKGTVEDFFYLFRDGSSEEVGANTKEFFRFDRILDNLEEPPLVTGFYLVDEKEKLPFYSEFTTTPAPNQKQFQPLTTKAAYTYGQEFSITEKTSLKLK